MQAVINAGGKQYVVSKNTVIKTEKMDGIVGSLVKFPALLASSEDGNSLVSHSNVIAEAMILEQKRDKKIIVFKKKRRKNYRRKNGHRQSVTVLRVVNLLAS